ncbi:MAG: XisI protein [Cyanobacteriota bacterium]|nr:XisI protein [Cyanobacteriota bacterium]
MDKLTRYREIVQQVLTDYSRRRSDSEVESQTLFDTKHDHYQIVNVGWSNDRRVYGCAFHLDIKNEKIWLQHNATEIDIAEQLMDLGVPRSDIVLGFLPPYRRQMSDYAVS